MLLLGVLQAQAAGQAAGSFDLLETQVLASSAASVTFSSLSTYAADYQHLQIRMAVRTDRSDTSDYLRMRFNADTAANYASHELIGTGSSVASGASTSATSMIFGRTGAASAASNIFGAAVVDLLDAFNSSKNTTMRSLGGVATTQIRLDSGHWRNVAALTSVTVLPGEGSNLVTGSRFSIYGWKAA